MVQGLAFLSKKSWHTKNLSNQEKVWIAEQREEQEKVKAKELAKQIQQEREQEELNRIAGKTSSIKDRGIDWMYHGHEKESEVAREDASKKQEEYLLGKEYIPNSGLLLKGDLAAAAAAPETAGSGGWNAVLQATAVSQLQQHDNHDDKKMPALYKEPSVAERNEAFRMRHEDPMFAVTRQEMQKRQELEKKKQLFEKVTGKTAVSIIRSRSQPQDPQDAGNENHMDMDRDDGSSQELDRRHKREKKRRHKRDSKKKSRKDKKSSSSRRHRHSKRSYSDDDEDCDSSSDGDSHDRVDRHKRQCRSKSPKSEKEDHLRTYQENYQQNASSEHCHGNGRDDHQGDRHVPFGRNDRYQKRSHSQEGHDHRSHDDHARRPDERQSWRHQHSHDHYEKDGEDVDYERRHHDDYARRYDDRRRYSNQARCDQKAESGRASRHFNGDGLHKECALPRYRQQQKDVFTDNNALPKQAGYGLQGAKNSELAASHRRREVDDLGPDQELLRRKRHAQEAERQEHRRRATKRPMTAQERAVALSAMEANAQKRFQNQQQRTSSNNHTCAGEYEQGHRQDRRSAPGQASFLTDMAQEIHGVTSTSGAMTKLGDRVSQNRSTNQRRQQGFLL